MRHALRSAQEHKCADLQSFSLQTFFPAAGGAATLEAASPDGKPHCRYLNSENHGGDGDGDRGEQRGRCGRQVSHRASALLHLSTSLCPALGCSAWSLSFGSAPCSGTMIRPPRLMRGRAQVYFNGRMVPEHEARVSIFDSALMFGDMVSSGSCSASAPSLTSCSLGRPSR